MSRMVLAFDTTAAIVALLTGSAVTAVLGYLGLRLTASGRARTTDADTLWQEAGRLRETLERDNRRLREEFDEARNDLYALRQRLVDLMAKVRKATHDATRWRSLLDEARAEIQRLSSENGRIAGEDES